MVQVKGFAALPATSTLLTKTLVRAFVCVKHRAGKDHKPGHNHHQTKRFTIHYTSALHCSLAMAGILRQRQARGFDLDQVLPLVIKLSTDRFNSSFTVSPAAMISSTRKNSCA